jgi:hypothetical protein
MIISHSKINSYIKISQYNIIISIILTIINKILWEMIAIFTLIITKIMKFYSNNNNNNN